MNHQIPPEAAGPFTAPMAAAIQACVHCGFCLPACPTYVTNQQEMDSPRGRILLMKNVLEGNLPLETALPHVDSCLGCLGCETACPSGVKYRELISPFRQMAQSRRKQGLLPRLQSWGLLHTLPYPSRFKLAVQAAQALRFTRPMLPTRLRPMLDLLPPRLTKPLALKAHYPVAAGNPKGRVALLLGCAQQVLAPGINAATIALLERAGVEIFIPEAQGCCGALAWHVGAGDAARAAARKNLAAFPRAVDAILTNAAGCGSGLHEYPLLFQGHPEQHEAKEFAHKVQDICQYLADLNTLPPVPPPTNKITVAYHDACHLSHAQGVRSAPRALLQSIPGLDIKEIPQGEICCGSAGTYNLDQPKTAAQLGKQKAENILSTGAGWLVAGNIGCLTQIESHLRQAPRPVRVVHTVELLEMAYQGLL